MSASLSVNSSSGISIMGLLGIAFIVLKLCGVINWSWWWVLSPFWIPVTLALSVFVILSAVIGFFGGRKSDKS